MIAIVDCNSFYASCEQVFRPDLWGKPVVVLSNNDGCIIAANKEAKALADISMFEPVFKIKKQLEQKGVTLFSSNYTLYGEMSQRVMNILQEFSPEVEIYSIDEAFLNLKGINGVSYKTYGENMRSRIYQYTGLPVGVGIAPTKVLAKVANKIAKKFPDKLQNVYVIDSEEKRIKALQWTKIRDIWGIGSRHAKRLKAIGVHTAYAFSQLPPDWVRKHMSVVGLRVWHELRGRSCLKIQEVPKTKQAISTAKSFGKKLEDLDLITEACSYYISEVALVLREQQSCANFLQVFLHTNYHSNKDAQYSKSITLTLPVATNDTFQLISQGRIALYKIFKPGYRYKKVGVCLTGIIPQKYVQGNLFYPPRHPHKGQLLHTVDFLNYKYGKATVYSALCGDRTEEWELVKADRSPCYTTQWRELLRVKPDV